MSGGAFLASEGELRWRVRVAQARGWRRWTDRTLAQADVTAPDGAQYLVRISRNLPVVGGPLGPFDNLLPQQVSLAVLVAANAYTRGRTGWSIRILKARTAWRSERVIYTRRSRVTEHVVANAVGLADALHRGEQPWETEEVPRNDRIKRLMNWD